MAKAFSIVKDAPSLSDLAYQAILDGITSGALAPGETLYEAKIAEQMGVSRAPVREAIQRLRQEGLVVAEQRKSPAVVRMTRSEVDDLYSVRIALETAALETLLSQDTKALCAKLEGQIDIILKHARAGQVAKVVVEEMRFHELIVEATNNALLADLYHSIVARVKTVLAADKYGFTDLVDVAEGHVPLLRAIKLRDMDQAKALLKEHILDSLPFVERFYAFATSD